MSLSPPAPRRLRHTRTITCEGFEREDGLWDIEARLRDSKSYAYREPERGLRPAGESVHDLWVRLTVGDDLIVKAIEVGMAAHPYEACLGAPPSFQALVGKSVGPGWRKTVQACVGGVNGCTHVRELLFPMATVAFQTVLGWPEDDGSGEAPPVTGDPKGFLNGCTAWDASGERVRIAHPQWYRPRPA